MQIKINNRTYDPRLTALNNIRREAENFLCYGDVLFNESNGNLTKMNELILDDIGPQGLLNEKEKQTILHILKGLDQNATVANAPVLKKELSVA